MIWRVELSSYKYDAVYHPGKDNKGADTFWRIQCSPISWNALKELHNSLCHLGITRMSHFVSTRNVLFSIDDIKKTTSGCQVCSELKSQFHKVQDKLINATKPFERLNIDFKGILPSSSQINYILTIPDEYSQLPFAFPCPDMNSSTVSKCLSQLFSIFGMSDYIHSDQGSSLISTELKLCLNAVRVATSQTSVYNP